MPLRLPPIQAQRLVSRQSDGAWGVGRAGMLYRDLLPDRAGGACIVSHIRIPVGGEVPDYVHFHRVAFQLIYVLAGWVDVVYEGQGAPFRLHARDFVTQPPTMARSMSIVSRMRHASASTASAWPCAMKRSTVALDEEYHRSARRAMPALAPTDMK